MPQQLGGACGLTGCRSLTYWVDCPSSAELFCVVCATGACSGCFAIVFVISHARDMACCEYTVENRLTVVALQMAPTAELLSLESLRARRAVHFVMSAACSFADDGLLWACLLIYVRVLPALLSSDGLSISDNGWLCLYIGMTRRHLSSDAGTVCVCTYNK